MRECGNLRRILDTFERAQGVMTPQQFAAVAPSAAPQEFVATVEALARQLNLGSAAQASGAAGVPTCASLTQAAVERCA